MTKYDFITVPERLSTNAVKWQATKEDKNLLPLWIADMDFVTFPEMTKALEEFARHGVYGYNATPDSLLDKIVNWEKEQHGYFISKEDITLIEGVVPAISVALQAFSKEGDAVLINTPVYPPFARTITLNQRKLVNNSLIEKNGHFEIDFEQLEKDIVEHQVKIYLFCSPHNPGGRVWSKDELEKIGKLCQKYHVILLSDEIHQDLALYGNQHHSFNTVSEDFSDFSVILSSATKTFNIAGTKNSFVLIKNPGLRAAFRKIQLRNNQHEISSLGLIATETALTYGKPWLEELKGVLEDNINYIADFLSKEVPRIKFLKPEGTYLIWLDFSDYGLSHSELFEKLEKEAGLILNDGLTFGREGKLHARLNAAAPRSIIVEACRRLAETF
ncbi:MalY/PatB family protein [Streptococcus sp. SGI.013]|uniref:MalY/PatB family protein n=1 Tax=unclassified Streptococcus TaxID=2608887 RepID=UPI003D03B182